MLTRRESSSRTTPLVRRTPERAPVCEAPSTLKEASLNASVRLALAAVHLVGLACGNGRDGVERRRRR